MTISAIIIREINEGVQVGLSVKFNPAPWSAPLGAAIAQYDIIMPVFAVDYTKLPEGIMTPTVADIRGVQDSLVPYQAWLLAQALEAGVPAWAASENAAVRHFGAIAATVLAMPGMRPLPAKWRQTDRRRVGTRETTRMWFKVLPYKAMNQNTAAAEYVLEGGIPAFGAISEPSVANGAADLGITHPGTPDAKAYISQFLGAQTKVEGDLVTSVRLNVLNPAVWDQVCRAGSARPTTPPPDAAGGISIPGVGGMTLC